MTVVWRETGEPKIEQYRCDLCGEQADTIHFVPWVKTPKQALFACPEHDPGGYWFRLKEWMNEADRKRWIEHLDGKTDGPEALALLFDRMNEMQRVTPPPTFRGELPEPLNEAGSEIPTEEPSTVGGSVKPGG